MTTARDIKAARASVRTPAERTWDAMRQMRVGITINRLLEAIGNASSKEVTQARVTHWTKTNHMVCVQPSVRVKGQFGVTTAVYEFVSNELDPPVRKTGMPQFTKRMAMWRAMKVLKTFNYRDIARAASFDDTVVSETSAKNYVRGLAKAGYLVGAKNARGGTSGSLEDFRLVRYTGPHAPNLTHRGVVYDRNTGETIRIVSGTSEGNGDA